MKAAEWEAFRGYKTLSAFRGYLRSLKQAKDKANGLLALKKQVHDLENELSSALTELSSALTESSAELSAA